jgi:hypothetical protein
VDKIALAEDEYFKSESSEEPNDDEMQGTKYLEDMLIMQITRKDDDLKDTGTIIVDQAASPTNDGILYKST